MMDVMNQMLREQDGSGAQYCMHGEGVEEWAGVGSRAAGVWCSSLVVSRGPGLRIVRGVQATHHPHYHFPTTRCACPVLPRRNRPGSRGTGSQCPQRSRR